MANNLTFPDLMSPMTFWRDLGLSALDQALSSTQDISDGVDRLARAGASVEPAEPAVSPAAAAVVERAVLPADFGLTLVLQAQRATLDLMMQGWQQWIASVGTLASLGAGSTFNSVERLNPWLNTLRERLVSEAETAEARAASRGSSPRQRGDSPQRHAERSDMEHALASATPQRRSRSGAKPRTGSRPRSNAGRKG